MSTSNAYPKPRPQLALPAPVVDAEVVDATPPVHIDTIRLNWLSRYDIVFNYSVRSNGSVLVRDPWPVEARDLRQAIDFIRCHIKEQPNCVACRYPLNEDNIMSDNPTRYYCPQCQTAFNWAPKKT